MTNRKSAILLAVFGNVIFGFSFLASKIALRTADPILLLALRFTVAFAVLNILLLLGVFKVRFKGKGYRTLIPMSICQPVIYFLCENYGLQHATSSFSGLMIAMIPAVTFLLATVILREPFRLSRFAWAVCSVAGVCVISATGGEGGATVKGVLFLSGAVLSGSLYVVLSRKCSDTFTAMERTYAMFAAGCVSFLTIAFLQKGGTLIPACLQVCKSPAFTAAVLYLAVVSSIAAFFCMNYAATYLPVTQTSSFANLSTLVSIVAGVVFLQEKFGVREVIGAVLIVCGVFMLNRADAKIGCGMENK